ncbi:MAG: metalloregulator ArsR/SmtB family transcription factor [Vicinamibacterales bacterium]
MPNQSARLSAVFTALADPTRRAVLAELMRGPKATTELCRRHDMALPSFTQHLAVLEDCGLVRSAKSGRVRTWRAVPSRLKVAEHWLNTQRTTWERRLDSLDAYLVTMKESE